MKERYTDAINAINEVAEFLASKGYQVDTTFHSNYGSMCVTIYFSDYTDKERIELLLTEYANDHDVIRYKHHTLENNSQFYTLTLYKNPS